MRCAIEVQLQGVEALSNSSLPSRLFPAASHRELLKLWKAAVPATIVDHTDQPQRERSDATRPERCPCVCRLESALLLYF